MIAAGKTRAQRPGILRTLLLAAAVLFVARLVPVALNLLRQGVPATRLSFALGPPALHWVLVTLVFVPGFLLAERGSASRGRAVPYTVLILVGSALVEALIVPLGGWVFMRPFRHLPAVFLDTAMRVALAAFVLAGHREQLEAVQAVQALETRRNEMMGRLAASRLQATRARVQPEAFIAELRAMRAAYLEEPATAEAGLEALITRLRAASRSAPP
jgi:hypothetical protein